ncbi:MFS transporter [Metallosphaera hakonensis]|uniref:MFS transporter n=1 Tax=Metallosphaera hakonensis TaxID=79601 RepID=UPI000A6765FE|nr:MFS transporter [Metallosphaera hakonensis]
MGNYLSNLEYTLITVYFPVASGIGRPLLGYIADRIGRMRGIDLMMLGMVGGVLITVMGNLERSSLLLLGILLVGIMGGSTFPMFSALVGDVYGSKYSTANTSILYTGKILSGVLGSVVFSSLFQVNDLAGLIFLLLSTIASISLLEVLHRV